VFFGQIELFLQIIDCAEHHVGAGLFWIFFENGLILGNGFFRVVSGKVQARESIVGPEVVRIFLKCHFKGSFRLVRHVLGKIQAPFKIVDDREHSRHVANGLDLPVAFIQGCFEFLFLRVEEHDIGEHIHQLWVDGQRFFKIGKCCLVLFVQSLQQAQTKISGRILGVQSDELLKVIFGSIDVLLKHVGVSQYQRCLIIIR